MPPGVSPVHHFLILCNKRTQQGFGTDEGVQQVSVLMHRKKYKPDFLLLTFN